MKKANDNDMYSMLNTMLVNGEAYRDCAYGIIQPISNIWRYMFGVLGTLIASAVSDDIFDKNRSCYIGITNSSINFAILDYLHVDQLYGTSVIPFSDITKIRIQEGLLMVTVTLYLGKRKIRFQMPKKVAISGLSRQSDGVQNVIALLRNAQARIAA